MSRSRSGLWVLFLLLVVGCQSFPQDGALSRIILVRHAEKQKGKNPHLTVQGKKRAMALKELSKIYNIQGVYSSNYNRTIETAKPLSEALSRSVDTQFSPIDFDGMLKNFRKKHRGEDVLVVGHSNTIPKFVNFLVGKEIQNEIDESDYSNLFVVRLAEKNSLKTYRYEVNRDGALEIKAIP